MKKTWFALWLLTLLACNAHGTTENPQLIVGMELSYPPFEMMSPEGIPDGVSVGIAEALGEYLNRKVVIDNVPFIGLIPSLQSGKIDLIISSMTVTDNRKKSIAFSEPYLTTGLCLLVSQKSDLLNIEQANQPSRKIAVKAGTSAELYAAEHLKLATIVILDKEASAVLEVVQGKVDAFIYDQFSVYTNWQRNLSTTRALLIPFKKEYWAIGLQLGNEVLLNQVNAFLVDFRQKGGFEKLGDKYLQQQKDAFAKLGIPFVF
jgi:polar amino acid transport system substrate-binding protein